MVLRCFRNPRRRCCANKASLNLFVLYAADERRVPSYFKNRIFQNSNFKVTVKILGFYYETVSYYVLSLEEKVIDQK